ncbi:LuxR family transcriptional regulator [Nocardioides sp. 1609]|uniref:AAA family ATPase n=1 Tax=Nocardioides sp. 1609 TaxID=2508327 RepID=UPI00106F4FC8|nr:LuxR family transcriptional regulator [Nocardioides sp. 1609]
MTRVVGRSTLLGEVHDLLDAGESVVLCGPPGSGKSALLELVEENARTHQRAEVLRSTGAPEEVALPFAALRDLLAQCPAELLDEVVAAGPPHVREAVDSGLVGVESTDVLRSDLAACFHAVLERWTADQPVLLLLDDVQWLDGDSSTVVGYARRRLGGRVGVVATVTSVGEIDASIDISDLHHLDVAPLDVVDMLDLLCDHGLTPDVAHRVHVESGGIPSLALAMAGLVGERPVVLGVPTPLPASIGRVLNERFAAQPDEVRETLLHAALLSRPTLRELERAGRVGAAADLRRAVQAGLVVPGEVALRFTPSLLRQVVVDAFGVETRTALHRTLADAATTPGQRLRHLALADPRPDADLARDLGAAATESARLGDRELAAELFLLAADRAPLELGAARIEWLVSAIETAAPGNHVDLVQRALADVLESPTTPAQAVRVRLAIPELAGNAVPLLDEMLTAALADAADDDMLVAKVLLQRARIALMESRPHAAHRACERAVALLEAHGDDDELALGLTTLAVARRWTGSDHPGCLQRAVELAGPTPTGFLHTSPVYMQARFAFYDDRLEVAWTAFLGMLAQVERGAGMDHVHVLRCLVEVAARTGRCREAAEYAARATRIGAEFDLEAHTGWFITAQAELVCGDLARAATLARRGVEAAAERGDVRYLQRHLVVLGQALLRSGDAQGARDALERVRAVERAGGFGDPTVNRWHADLVAALAALGRLDEAAEVLGEARYAVERRASHGGTAGVSAQLDRAEAELLVAHGDLEGAELVLDRAAKVAADLGLQIDVGRVLVTRAHLERRRRRVAAARTTLQEAHDLFTGLHATPWAEQVHAELEPERAPETDDPLLERLTDTEARIAQAVAAGASNREIAERAYVSVKTVEATLTRIYRKLDLRSRTQLATLLVPPPRE